MFSFSLIFSLYVSYFIYNSFAFLPKSHCLCINKLSQFYELMTSYLTFGLETLLLITKHQNQKFVFEKKVERHNKLRAEYFLSFSIKFMSILRAMGNSLTNLA